MASVSAYTQSGLFVYDHAAEVADRDGGAPGADGAQGADGAHGADGAQGADGAHGVDGAQGADGAHGLDGVRGADSPCAPLVVLVHGSMDRGTSFARLRNCLRDLHVVTYDRRGYHRSRRAGQDTSSGFDGHVDDLVEILDGREATVLGHSFGGVIALATAQRHPDLVHSVVAFEPPLTWRPWWPRPRKVVTPAQSDPGNAAEAFIRRMIGEARWDRLPERTRAERRAEGPALVSELRSLRGYVEATGKPPFDAEAMKVPTVVARGARTEEHQLRGTSELVREIPGSELAEVPGAGHGAHLTHPAPLADIVRRAAGRPISR